MNKKVKYLFEKNSLEYNTDFFFLIREISRIKRCHSLPIGKEQGVGEHILNCLFLADFLHRQNLYTPKNLSKKQLEQLKFILQYHDVEETIIGDIPYHVGIILKADKLKSNTRKEIIKYYSNKDIESLPQNIILLSGQIDILDFLFTMERDQFFYKNYSYNGKRIKKIIKDTRAELVKISEIMKSKNMISVDLTKLDFVIKNNMEKK